MPYEWLSADTVAPDPSGAVQLNARLRLWPHRSLSRAGFVWFIGGTAALIALPLVGLLGNPALWFMLPFLAAAVAAIWWALRRSYRDGEILEDLTLGTSRVTLTRVGPRGRVQAWDGNSHWLRATLHETGGPVPNYLTLKAEGREVELGAFLSEEERIALAADLRGRLARA